MSDNISAVNHSGYSNELLSYNNSKNRNVVPNLNKAAQDTVSFTGNDEDDKAQTAKEKSSKSHVGAYIISAVLIVGAILTGKYFGKIKGLFKSKGTKEAAETVKDSVKKAADTVADKAKETASKAKDKLTKAKNKVGERIRQGKQKLKNTSSTGASNTVSPEMEHRTVTNINTQNVNANTRSLVEDAQPGLVSSKQQAAYDTGIAHRPMTQRQAKAKAKLDAKNAAQRAKMNSVANNSKGGEKLEALAVQTAKAEKAAAAIADGGYINPANKYTYYTKNGTVTHIKTLNPDKNGNYMITDPKKIAKHLAKHKIDIAAFADKKIINAAA